MKIFHKKILWLIIGMIGALAFSIALPFLMQAIGYYTLHPGWEVAEILVASDKGVEDCQKIRRAFWFDLLSPPGSEQRALCVYTYAKLKQDPSACKLLLPSEYGINCIASAENYPHGECYLHDDNKLTCTIPGLKNIQSSYHINQIDNCEAYLKHNNRQVVFWCHAERANRFGELEICLMYAISDSEKDYCYYQKATMLEDLQNKYCVKIKDKQTKLGCRVTIDAWTKYPELKPVERTEIKFTSIPN